MRRFALPLALAASLTLALPGLAVVNPGVLFEVGEQLPVGSGLLNGGNSPDCVIAPPAVPACEGPVTRIGDALELSLGWFPGAAGTARVSLGEKVGDRVVLWLHCAPTGAPTWAGPVECTSEGAPVFHTDARLVLQAAVDPAAQQAAVGLWYARMG